MSAPLMPVVNDLERAGWTTARVMFLLELLLEQAANGRKTDTGFTRDAWKSACFTFNLQFNLKYTITQLKRRCKKLKTQYKMVKTLQCQDGFRWDDAVKAVIAEDDVWERYITVCPNAREYKNRCFPLFDQCSVLFDGKRTEGRFTVSTIRHELIPNIYGTETMEASFNDVNGNVYEDEDSFVDAFPWEIPESHKRKDNTIVSRRVRQMCSSPEHRIAAALENVSSELSSDCRTLHADDGVSYQLCLIELQNMQGLDPDDCVKAATILKDPLNRVAFVTFNQDLRGRWLQNELQKFKR